MILYKCSLLFLILNLVLSSCSALTMIDSHLLKRWHRFRRWELRWATVQNMLCNIVGVILDAPCLVDSYRLVFTELYVSLLPWMFLGPGTHIRVIATIWEMFLKCLVVLNKTIPSFERVKEMKSKYFLTLNYIWNLRYKINACLFCLGFFKRFLPSFFFFTVWKLICKF